MEYFLQHPIPLAWFFSDVVTIGLTVWLLAFLFTRSPHPAVILLEGVGFVFLYASVFENFAVVQGWYVYGRSFLMVGDVPLSIPLIEMDVFLGGLWILERMALPTWSKPFLLGLFGMLQDFSLDPVAVRQVFTVSGATSGRWTWLLEPRMVNIYHIPVYNFPGWMLIMLYGSIFILLGRAWFRRSGEKPWVGYVYPFAAFLLAFLAMVSPVSQALLWLAPFFAKGSFAEWIMLGFHLAFPALLLLFAWRGRMLKRIDWKSDLPVFAVPVCFHVWDILCALSGGFGDVLWLVILASAIHALLLQWVLLSKMSPIQSTDPSVGSLAENA